MRILVLCVLVVTIALSGCRLKHSSKDDVGEQSDEILSDSLISYTPMPDTPTSSNCCWYLEGCQSVDTVDVTYTNYACDCPSWFPTNNLPLDSEHFYNDLQYGYYIESAGDRDTLSNIASSGMRVLLYGRKDTTKRYPRNARFIDKDPPKGLVFTYCGFRILDFGPTM